MPGKGKGTTGQVYVKPSQHGGKGLYSKTFEHSTPYVRSHSKRAGLEFPVRRIRCYLKASCGSKFRIALLSAIYLAAVLEYLVAELLELGGNAAQAAKKKRINPRHLLFAIRNDNELDTLVGKGVIINSGGVVPFIHTQLLPKKNRRR